jgi:7-carboxy-7-deazaguanine synthase
MENPDYIVEGSEDAWPLMDWDFDPNNEVSTSRLLARSGGSSPHFAFFGPAALTATILSFREQHVLIAGREPCGFDIEPVIRLLRAAGRQVQIETAGNAKRLPSAQAGVWLTLKALPMQDWTHIAAPVVSRADEVIIYIRNKRDLDRAEQMFGSLTMPVWLGPAPSAEPSVYAKCFAVATRHLGWRAFR